MRVLAISGSLRRDSHNTTLLRAAAELMPSPAEVSFFEGLREIPPYDQDDDVEPAPEAVQRLREAIASADAILIATPEYNASIPGQLKNAIDWASRPKGSASLLGKPAAVIGASTGSFGGVWAQAELRKVLSTAGARAIDKEVAVSRADDAFDENGRLKDRELQKQLEELLAELVSEAEQDAAIREARVAA